MTIEQIHLKSLIYPVEELRVLSEDEDVYVIYNLSDLAVKTFRLEDYNRHRIRPLSWFIKNKSTEEIEHLFERIWHGGRAVVIFRFKYEEG